MKNIKVIRLQTGEELIGTIKEDGDTVISIQLLWNCKSIM